MKNYFFGYAEAMGGSYRARRGICSFMHTETEENPYSTANHEMIVISLMAALGWSGSER